MGEEATSGGTTAAGAAANGLDRIDDSNKEAAQAAQSGAQISDQQEQELERDGDGEERDSVQETLDGGLGECASVSQLVDARSLVREQRQKGEGIKGK